MKNIGLILPYTKEKNHLKRFFCKKFYVENYDFNFIVVNQRQNFKRIFRKNNVKQVVISNDCKTEISSFEILTGDSIYKKMIPDYVRKIAKKYGLNCSVTLVDKKMSQDGILIVDKLCGFCRMVNINTFNLEEGENLCEILLDKYGIAVNVIGEGQVINTDIAVVLEDCGNKYGNECLVINKDNKSNDCRMVSDFYIPFRTKPPFGMSNLVFAECIASINK